METGPQHAIDKLKERETRWFDPDATRAALALDRAGVLWQHCLPADGHADAYQDVLAREPVTAARLESRSLDQICEAFAEVVDAKSPFTYRHSVGVKDAAVMIAQTMGLSQSRVEMLRRAALLHDIGKLSVSNLILDKPGRLDAAEFAVMKRHSAWTAEILGRMPSFVEVPAVAGEHHEKLDGSGYPRGLRARDLSLESRLIAVADVYGALSEDRPYRPAMSPEAIAVIMQAEVPGRLDPQCFAALEASLSGSQPGPGAGLAAIPVQLLQASGGPARGATPWT
ncbi:MAG TPA: HD-GYP domain-containing protein [Acidobacteriaceae bacterium]